MQFKVNSCSFTGKVDDFRESGDEVFILLKAKVSGRMETKFPVVLKKSVYEKMEPVALGMYLSVFHVPVDIDNGKYRFRATSTSQIWRIKPRPGETFSQATFSGRVASLSDDDESYIVHLIQDDAPRKTEFLLVIGKRLYPQISITFEDEVLISNAQAYQKDGVFRYRIMSASQLKLIKRNNPDKGIVQARDKFI